MVEASLPAPDDVRPWPGILTQPRRAMRVAADERIWAGLLLAYVGLWVAVRALMHLTGAPPPKPPFTGQAAGDIAVTAAVIGLAMVVLPFALGRLVGGQASLFEVFVVALWSEIPTLLLVLPVELIGLLLHGSAWWSMSGSLTRPSATADVPVDVLALNYILKLVVVWCTGLLTVGLSEVHRISHRRVLLGIVLPLFLLGVVTVVVATILVAKSAATAGR